MDLLGIETELLDQTVLRESRVVALPVRLPVWGRFRPRSEHGSD
jgi:hypothetical protein